MIRVYQYQEQSNLASALPVREDDEPTMFVGLIHSLFSMVEIKDPYTATHQRRVTQLARAIAQELNLTESIVRGISIAGLVHDIGKIFVPTEILNKPSGLTEVETTIIREHPRLGYLIIKDIDFAWPIAQIILQHHERMDGSGYPNGLRGDTILLEARILAVADVVEAMSAIRPYRAALDLDDVLDETERNKGILYDTDAVNACVQLFRHKYFHLELGREALAYS